MTMKTMFFWSTEEDCWKAKKRLEFNIILVFKINMKCFSFQYCINVIQLSMQISWRNSRLKRSRTSRFRQAQYHLMQ